MIMMAILILVTTTGCKAELGGSDDSDSSILDTLYQMEGYQYYEHENMCNEFPTLCESSNDILTQFNDPDAGVDAYGQESEIDTDGNANTLNAIGVDTDHDGIFDFVVADMDADGVFESVLVREDSALLGGSDSTAQSDGVGFGDEVWCGTNTIQDIDGDGVITAEETQRLMDGKIGVDTCNDPDFFCTYYTGHDSRCDAGANDICIIDPETGTCDHADSSWDD